MKKTLFLTLFLIFICFTLLSQSKVDSLKSQLESAILNEQFLILRELIAEYEKIDAQIMLDYAVQGLEMAKSKNNPQEEAAFLVLVGKGLYYTGDFDNAMDHYYDALRKQEQLDDIRGQIFTLQKIAHVYDSIDKIDRVLEYFQKAYGLAETLGDKTLLARISQSIATCYCQMNGDFQTAIEYYKQALQLFREMDYEEAIIVNLNNIGLSYNELGNSSLALPYLEEALQRARKSENKHSIAMITRNIGVSYLGLGEFKKAEEYLIEVLRISKNDYPSIRLSILKILSEMYLETENYSKAYVYLERAINLKDSLMTIDTEEKILEIQTKYETEKKEQQIVLLEKDKTISGMKLKRQRSLLLYLTGGIVMIFLFVLILSNLYRQKVKTAAALAVANGKLEELSRTDPLTKLWNRRYLHEIIELERIRIKRAFEPFSFILMDIDHFKNVNDTYGHECGDYVLATLAVILRSAVRKQDLVGRWGGEEFLLFLPKTSLKGAITIAESVRKKIEDYPFSYSSKKIAVTATFGVSQYEKPLSVDECIKLSDDALYEGKESGRNRVVSVQEEDDLVG